MNEETKERALATFDKEWTELDVWFRQMYPDDLEHPVFVDEGIGWRVRDVIPHIAAWQERAARAARKVAAENLQPDTKDSTRTILGIEQSADTLNEETFKAWRERSVADALLEMRAQHEELMSALNELRPEQLMAGDTPEDVHTCFRMPGLQHLRIHKEHLQAALADEGVTR
ncbi:MAG TPA: maleylpyruvate isomerase N-terminal domain-containing protein [Candidatus Limnocylindrales bacterium]|nr:maleylpyruvate isomerase N-terminal domain-containing protein [Candidatus Limnocylindrales bacterium]